MSPSNNVAWAEANLRTKWNLDPSNRMATIHHRYRQDKQTGPLGPVAYGEPLLVTVAQKGRVAPASNAVHTS